MSDSERDELVDHLLEKVKQGVKDNTISIDSIIELFQYDGYESSVNPFDQCGDYIERTFYKI